MSNIDELKTVNGLTSPHLSAGEDHSKYVCVFCIYYIYQIFLLHHLIKNVIGAFGRSLVCWEDTVAAQRYGMGVGVRV